ncbi:hypothetical protein Tco_0946196 [Tanacetum coccineum]
MGGRSTLYCQGEELVLLVLPVVCLYCQWQLILLALSLKVSAAAYPDLWIVVLRIGKLQGIGEFSVQTASGKEFSNPLIADSLLKTIWFSTHHASQSGDIEDSLVNDRFAEGMHAVPPPMTGIYIPSGPDVEIDESQFTYGPKQSKPSEPDARNSDFNSCESNSSEETLKSMPEPVVDEPKVVSHLKVWSDAPIIEEYESDSDDEHVSLPTKEQETHSFAFVNTVKHVKTPRQTVKEQNTCSQNPKPDKKDWNGLMSKKIGLGYGFTKKACFVCGSFSHLIRDCDFHEKRMAKQVELNKQKVNTARASGTNQVSTARHNFNRQAVLTNAARKVNNVKPIVNDVRQKTVFHKSHSPIRRSFKSTTATKTNIANQKVNTAGDKAVSVVGGIGKTAVKPSTDYVWRPKRTYLNKFSKYNGGLNSRKFDVPHKALENKGYLLLVDDQAQTGETRHILLEYQDYNGVPCTYTIALVSRAEALVGSESLVGVDIRCWNTMLSPNACAEAQYVVADMNLATKVYVTMGWEYGSLSSEMEGVAWWHMYYDIIGIKGHIISLVDRVYMDTERALSREDFKSERVVFMDIVYVLSILYTLVFGSTGDTRHDTSFLLREKGFYNLGRLLVHMFWGVGVLDEFGKDDTRSSSTAWRYVEGSTDSVECNNNKAHFSEGVDAGQWRVW